MNIELKNRILSFVWRFGAYIVVAALGFLLESISALNLVPEVYAVIALIVGELTKFLNNKYNLKKNEIGFK